MKDFEDRVRFLLSMEKEKAHAYIASVEESVRILKDMLEKETHEREKIHKLLSNINQNQHYQNIVKTWHEIYHEYNEYLKQAKYSKS